MCYVLSIMYLCYNVKYVTLNTIIIMNKITFTKEEQDQLQKQGVAALVLFGSHAQNYAGPMSDVDIGVLVERRSILYDRAKRNELYNMLYDLLSAKIKKLIDIDIVFLREAPQELQMHAARYGIVLIEPHQNTFVQFREEVFEQYADFAPLRAVFHQQILARIS